MRSSRLFWKLVLAMAAVHLVLAPLLGIALQRGGAVVLVVAACGVGMVAAAAAWLVALRSWRGMDELTKNVSAMARNESPADLEIDRRSEAAPAMLAFEQLRQRLTLRFRRLEEQNDRLFAVLDGMEEGVLALDPERRVLLANAASRRLLQIPAGLVVGRPFLELVRSREIHAAVEGVLARGQPEEAEYETTEPRRRLHVLARRLSGEPLPGVLLMLRDVSNLRRLENLRSEFAANVSHELKTPLASIKAYAETLRLGAVNDPDHNLAFVGRIEEHADRLHFLIADLLHLARVESGKEVFEIADLPLLELVEDCLDYHRESAAAKQIAVKMLPPPSPLEVRGDEVGVRTILDNLVSNAINYTSEGGRVEINWRRDAAQVLLEVRDTGIGIAPEDQDRVFERFFRVDKARSRELAGTGLGLSIVKHTALSLGGRVGLESRLGQGSVFRVWLPEGNGAATI
jgi:two-component system, OmpR family, phosphate regulon sensor histidine kinase PhoR